MSQSWRERPSNDSNNLPFRSNSNVATQAAENAVPVNNVLEAGETDLLSLMSSAQREIMANSTNASRGSDDSSQTSPPETADYSRDFQVHSIRELAPGMIVYGLHITEALEKDVTSINWRIPSHTFKVNSDTSRTITYKHRLLLVLTVYDTHYVVAPIFTKRGRGLQGVPEYDWKHYMSIRDHRSDDFECQNMDLPVLDTKELEAGLDLIAPRAIVMFDAPYTMWARHPIEIVGQLTSESTAVLLQHYYLAGKNMLEPTPEVIEKLEDKTRGARARQVESKEDRRQNPNLANEVKAVSSPLGQIPTPLGTQSQVMARGNPPKAIDPKFFANAFNVLGLDEDDDREDDEFMEDEPT